MPFEARESGNYASPCSTVTQEIPLLGPIFSYLHWAPKSSSMRNFGNHSTTTKSYYMKLYTLIRHTRLNVRISAKFLSRVSTLTRDIDIAILSVRLSVRDVPVSDENGLIYCHSFFFTIR